MSDNTPCAHLQFIGAREFCPDCGLSRSEALVEACAPFLKDGETPAECIARNRRDTDGVLSLLIAARQDNERLRGLLRDGRANTVALLQVMRDAARHLPAKAPIDMPEANRVTSEVIEWIARVDALGAADQPEPQSPTQEGEK